MHPCDLLTSFIVDNELTSFYSFEELICQIKIEWQAPPLLPRWSLSFHNYYINSFRIYKLQHDEFSSFAIVDILPYDPSNPYRALNTFVHVQVKLALTIWLCLIVTLICNPLMFHVNLAFIIWAFSWFFDFMDHQPTQEEMPL